MVNMLIGMVSATILLFMGAGFYATLLEEERNNERN